MNSSLLVLYFKTTHKPVSLPIFLQCSFLRLLKRLQKVSYNSCTLDHRYVDILKNSLPFSAYKMGLTSFTFQQDNDPKHVFRYTKGYFQEIGLICFLGHLNLPI